MIERYTRPEMGDIWTDRNRFAIWLEIEILACEARAELGHIPHEDVKLIREKAAFDVDRVLEIEKETHHDVIAFLTNVAEYVGEPSRHIHYGMTSSDVLDTCLAVQLRQAGLLILGQLKELELVLAKRAREFKHTLCIGRSHGIHAEPVTFGLKLALWREECKRNIERLLHAIDRISYGQISGAVGTFQHLPTFVEKFVCERLDLKPAPISTQVIQRDRHAEFISTLAIVGTMLERIATEIRHLQRTEVLEAEEFFAKGQKGSSAMPHKRNPIISERLCGMARLLRGNTQAALENVALWHERDISHSSVERVICPDSTITLHYMLHKTIPMIEQLLVYPEAMQKNMDVTSGLFWSQTILLELAKRGVSREDAYKMVQRNAMKTWEDRKPFVDRLKADEELTAILPADEIDRVVAPEALLTRVDEIFERCGLGDN